MAFPTTGILDDFDRGNENPATGWTDVANGLEVVSNQCEGESGADNLAYWDDTTFGPDMEAYFTMANHTADTFGVFTRFVIGTVSGYLVYGNSGTIVVSRMDNGGAPTQLGSSISQTMATGDKIGAESVGDIHSAYYKDGVAAWGDISGGGREDNTYQSANYVAAYLGGAVYAVDDFGGGTIAAGPAAKAVAGSLAMSGALARKVTFKRTTAGVL